MVCEDAGLGCREAAGVHNEGEGWVGKNTIHVNSTGYVCVYSYMYYRSSYILLRMELYCAHLGLRVRC